MQIAFELFFTYVLSSLILCQAMYVSSFPRLDKAYIYLLGIGPLFISWILVVGMKLSPGHSITYYKCLVYAVFAVIGLLALAKKYSFALTYTQSKVSFKLPASPKILLSSTVFAVLVLMITAFLLPMTGADQMSYFAAAGQLYQKMSFTNYPFYSQNITGLTTAWTHPPGFIGLILWHDMLQGHAAYAGIGRLIAPFFALCTAACVFMELKPCATRISFLGVLLLLSTPMFLYGAVTHHIDPIRIYTFFIFFILLRQTLEHHCTSSSGLVLGITLGLALFCHSINILIFPILAVAILIFSEKTYHQAWQYILVLITSICFVLDDFIRNYQVFGSFLQDSNLIWEIIEHNNFVEQARGIDTLPKKMFNGFFQGWSKIQFFGITYWLLLILGSIWCFSKSCKSFCKLPMSTRYYGTIVLIFFSMVLVSIIFSSLIFIKNPRYFLTIQPLICILIGTFINSYYENK